MTSLRSITYSSAATYSFDDALLENLLVSARNFNTQASVTGVLLYREGTFFQYLEGPPDGVVRAYERILASKSHRAVIKLSDDDIAQREFPDWNMRLVTRPESALLRFSQAWWELKRRKLDDSTQAKTDGLLLLQAFRRGNAHKL